MKAEAAPMGARETRERMHEPHSRLRALLSLASGAKAAGMTARRIIGRFKPPAASARITPKGRGLVLDKFGDLSRRLEQGCLAKLAIIGRNSAVVLQVAADHLAGFTAAQILAAFPWVLRMRDSN